jgi:hypothetical protein
VQIRLWHEPEICGDVERYLEDLDIVITYSELRSTVPSGLGIPVL